MVCIIQSLESSLRKNFIPKEERQMSQLPSICAMRTCVKEAYGTELLKIKVTSEAKVSQLHEATDAKWENWMKAKKTWLFPVQLKNTLKHLNWL